MRFQEGLKFADAGKFEDARQAFVQAYALHPTQPTLWNLAIAEMRVGRHAEALRHLRMYRSRSPQDPEYAKLLPDLVTKLEAQSAQLRIAAARGAEIVVDGERYPERAPLEDPVAVMPGAHVIEARDGASSTRKDITVKLGDTIGVDLVPPRAAHDGPPAFVPPPEREKPSLVGPIVLGVAGLVGLGVGAGFGLASQSKKDDADALDRPGVCAATTTADCQSFNNARESGNRADTISVVAYVSGGVLLAGGVAWALVSRASWSPAPTTKGALHVLPLVDSQRAGLFAVRTF